MTFTLIVAKMIKSQFRVTVLPMLPRRHLNIYKTDIWGSSGDCDNMIQLFLETRIFNVIPINKDSSFHPWRSGYSTIFLLGPLVVQTNQNPLKWFLFDLDISILISGYLYQIGNQVQYFNYMIQLWFSVCSDAEESCTSEVLTERFRR